MLWMVRGLRKPAAVGSIHMLDKPCSASGACGGPDLQLMVGAQGAAGDTPAPSRKRDAPDEPPSAPDEDEMPGDVRQRLAALRGSGVD